MGDRKEIPVHRLYFLVVSNQPKVYIDRNCTALYVWKSLFNLGNSVLRFETGQVQAACREILFEFSFRRHFLSADWSPLFLTLNIYRS